MLDMEQLYPFILPQIKELLDPATWLLSKPLFARVVCIKPLQVNIRWIELLSLAKTPGRSFSSTGTVDNRPLVRPLLAFYVTIHETKRAGIVVKDAQGVPHSAAAWLIRPSMMIIVA